VASSAAEHQSKATDYFIRADAFKDEGGPLIKTACLPRVALRLPIPALRRKANACDPVGRFATMPPQSTHLACGAVVGFAGRRVPGVCPAGPAPDLDEMRALRVNARHPIEAVAAQVH